MLFVAALVVKGAVLFALHAHPLLAPRGSLDTAVYVDLARQVAGGDVLLGNEPFYVSPLYVYFLAVVFACGGSLLAAKIVQILLGALAVVLIGERSWKGAVLLLLTGVVTFYEVTILQTALDPFLVAVIVVLFLEERRPPAGPRPPKPAGGRRSSFLLGAVFALFVLNRPNAILVLVALLAYLAWKHRHAAVWTLAGAVLVIAPVTIRNYAVSGQVVLIASHGGLNLHIGNNDTADGTYQRVPGIRPDIRGQRLDAKNVDFTARALTWMREHPGRALALFLRKLALTINRADIALNYSYAYYREIPPLPFLIVGPWLLFPLAAGSAWCATGLRPALRPPPQSGPEARTAPAAFLVLYAVSVAIFFISSRYRLPLLVPAALLAGATLDDLLRRRNTVRHLIAAALIAIPVYWNFHLEDGRETEAEGLVFYRIEQGDYSGAQTLLDQIDDTHPDPSMLYYRTALSLRDAKRTAEATAMFDRARTAPSLHPETPLAASTALAEAYVSQGRVAEALSLAQSMDPSHFDAPHAAALGRIAMNARDPRTAQSYFTRAAALDPNNPALHHDLGIAAYSTGDRPTARRAFETAIHLDPQNASSLVNLAVIEAEAGEVEAARAHARRAVEAKPGWGRAVGLVEALGREGPVGVAN